ncbi:MAG: alpha/beta hydrolase, partial [Treponema sp.]|nr:alpha/beta hydrolase [Treponema sp.]
TNADRDAMLTTAQLDRWAQAYAGKTPRDEPYISPRFGAFTGLPPMLIQVDESEILFDDSRSVAEAARAAGVNLSFQVWQGLWHVWPAVGPMLPETGAAYKEIGSFLKSLGLLVE